MIIWYLTNNNTCRQDNPRECDLQLWNCSSGSSKWQAYSSKPCMLRSNKIQSLHSYKNVLYALFCFIRHYKHSMLPYIFWISLVFDVNHMIQSNSCEYCLVMTFWLWEFALNICWSKVVVTLDPLNHRIYYPAQQH